MKRSKRPSTSSYATKTKTRKTTTSSARHDHPETEREEIELASEDSGHLGLTTMADPPIAVPPSLLQVATIPAVSTQCTSSATEHPRPLLGVDLQSEVDRLLRASLSTNTHKAHDTGLASFTRFLGRYQLREVWPPPVDNIVNFIALLSISGLSDATARAYTEAISFKCKMLGLQDPTKNFIVVKVLEGMKRVKHRPDTRLPITSNLLAQLITALPHICSNSYEEKLFTSAYTLAFFGFLRVGELAVSTGKAHNKVIASSDITVD
ncbi:LOW QUALITY PROTEIN: uncharacterized protein LOC121389741 [Gigantopelta aegis]|uniref:LOW QUALITY PROTEIN: uncharacterized protein LOC121389741 n=1 Tax=Gigantopelta aegis TaxID=1735272 RepID=UPI001B88C222|nr:LOW QUALITY PROTEIN: uncharacterized protein LOC121389741 [Gigantopelta aegis]